MDAVILVCLPNELTLVEITNFNLNDLGAALGADGRLFFKLDRLQWHLYSGFEGCLFLLCMHQEFAALRLLAEASDILWDVQLVRVPTIVK